MPLKHLDTFRAVARFLHFTRAAEHLHLAQSSVSAQIKALEEDLGVPLFDRIGRRVLLTHAGQRLESYARRMEEMEEEIRADLSQATEARGSLTIRVPESLAAVYMPTVTSRYRDTYPGVRLRYINCTDQRLRQELHSGRIDLAFLMIDSITFNQVNVRMLGEEELVLVGAPDHPMAGRQGLSLQDLQGETLLMPGAD